MEPNLMGYLVILNAVVLPLALLVDRLIGDPRSRYHPVVLIGSFIGWWGRPMLWPPGIQRIAGAGMWVVTVILFLLPFFLVSWLFPWFLFLPAGALLLKFCLAWRSLEEHAAAVDLALGQNITEGQNTASLMVSRDIRNLTPEQVRSAAYESVAENLVDSIVSPLFYFGLFGLPGAAVFRAANTMDAMLGYRDERKRIGWWSARMDDILNFIPARVAGGLLILYFAAQGRFSQAWQGLIRDRRKRPGMNGGIPMSIIAAGVGVRFEKPGVYVMGTGERSLEEAGEEIVKVVRVITVAFCALISMGLFLLGSGIIYTGL
ncbi:MAG: adenosylcobinamide-phosphate synthase CbiB [Methanomicrobiales archaeon]